MPGSAAVVEEISGHTMVDHLPTWFYTSENERTCILCNFHEMFLSCEHEWIEANNILNILGHETRECGLCLGFKNQQCTLDDFAVKYSAYHLVIGVLQGFIEIEDAEEELPGITQAMAAILQQSGNANATTG